VKIPEKEGSGEKNKEKKIGVSGSPATSHLDKNPVLGKCAGIRRGHGNEQNLRGNWGGLGPKFIFGACPDPTFKEQFKKGEIAGESDHLRDPKFFRSAKIGGKEEYGGGPGGRRTEYPKKTAQKKKRGHDTKRFSTQWRGIRGDISQKQLEKKRERDPSEQTKKCVGKGGRRNRLRGRPRRSQDENV